MAWIKGYGVVAVSELKIEVAEASRLGLGRGGGKENTRDALNRAPPGDMLREAIVAGDAAV